MQWSAATAPFNLHAMSNRPQRWRASPLPAHPSGRIARRLAWACSPDRPRPFYSLQLRSSRLQDVWSVLPELLVAVLCFLGMTLYLPG